MRAAADTVASEPDRDTLCARCSALLQQMCELEQCISAMEQREVIAWQPRLRDLAAQILLHACGGRQEVVLARPAGCGCFAEMAAAENDDSLRLQRVATCLGMELAQLGEAADAVLQMGRSGTHAHTAAGGVASRLLVSLEAEVHAVRSCITPALEQACPQECRIVRGYEVIKAAFPARFR
ncbi:hypothetical protein HXX76_014274 [Chlamydomonas incerta]|uniref:Uncharacterized protein n=1 Tax=Chlamydomonas incerta TaxID=51695 RepID=A0A835SJN9_CHLIN|nr:hypothetical protein HXX76_014274 [Chlamydomonas incerta]|eukprot:KAG2424698.1 hypothetical protein HXX76_014274 [Chlamydomonas incerta]